MPQLFELLSTTVFTRALMAFAVMGGPFLSSLYSVASETVPSYERAPGMKRIKALRVREAARTRALEHIIFHHIPKTGGTTVTFLLDKKFSQDDIGPYDFYHQLDSVSLRELVKYKFVRGHFFYPQLRNLPGRHITFLREPVDRIISEHFFWKEFYTGREADLPREHFFPLGDPLLVMRNHQCLFLSSFDPRDSRISIKKHLESAKSNLANHFFFVGVTEDLERSIQLLYALMGWPPLDSVPRLQATHESKRDIPEELIAQIRERNWADIELYAFAKSLYAARLRQLGLSENVEGS